MSESESELFSIHNFTLTFNRVSYLKWISFSDVQHPVLFMIRVFYFQHDPESSRGYLRSQVDGGTRWHSKHNLSWTWRRVTSWKKRTTINQYSSTIKPLSLDSKRIWKTINLIDWEPFFGRGRINRCQGIWVINSLRLLKSHIGLTPIVKTMTSVNFYWITNGRSIWSLVTSK